MRESVDMTNPEFHKAIDVVVFNFVLVESQLLGLLHFFIKIPDFLI